MFELELLCKLCDALSELLVPGEDLLFLLKLQSRLYAFCELFRFMGLLREEWACQEILSVLRVEFRLLHHAERLVLEGAGSVRVLGPLVWLQVEPDLDFADVVLVILK